MLKQVKQQSSLCTFWTFKYTSRNFLQFHILEIHFFNLYNSTMDRFKHFSKTNYPSGKGCHCWHLRFSAFSHLLAYLSFSAIMLTLVSIQKCTKAKTASLLFFVLDMVCWDWGGIMAFFPVEDNFLAKQKKMYFGVLCLSHLAFLCLAFLYVLSRWSY